MEGWVGHVGWPIADGVTTKWSPVQLAVWHRIRKVYRPRAAFNPLRYAARSLYTMWKCLHYFASCTCQIASNSIPTYCVSLQSECPSTTRRTMIRHWADAELCYARDTGRNKKLCGKLGKVETFLSNIQGHRCRRFWHATQDCVAPYVDHILHRDRFWAISIAWGSVKLWDVYDAETCDVGASSRSPPVLWRESWQDPLGICGPD